MKSLLYVFDNYPYLLWYVAAINLLTFLAFAIDKQKAAKHKWRIPERTLLVLCFLGGALGGYLSMQIFHHKTRKKYFAYGVPAFFLLHLLLCYLFLYKF